MRLITHYFSVTRAGTANTLINLGAYLYPAGPNIVAFIDYPASVFDTLSWPSSLVSNGPPLR